MTWKKVDTNQGLIVDQLRDLGVSVTDLHTLGRGVPDLLIGIAGVSFLVEVKADCKKHLTPDQHEWLNDWNGNFIMGWDITQIINHVIDYLMLYGMGDHPECIRLRGWVTNETYKGI